MGRGMGCWLGVVIVGRVAIKELGVGISHIHLSGHPNVIRCSCCCPSINVCGGTLWLKLNWFNEH